MSWQCVHEFWVVEQPADFFADVAAEFARGIRDLLDNRGASVKDRYDVFECMSSEPFGQVSERFKRESGPSGLKMRLSPDGAAVVLSR